MRALACLTILAVAGTASAARLRGTPRADVLRGTAEADFIDGRGGRDHIFGLGGADRLIGGRGGDLLVGGAGTDRIDARDPGGACVLRPRATAGALDYPRCADVILGGPGPDRILARDGRLDVIWFCGAGHDTVTADPRDVVAGDCESVSR